MTDYLFSEDGACRDFDYFNQRHAQRKLIIPKERDGSSLGRSLSVRTKGLPPKFKTQSNLDFVRQVMTKNVTTVSGYPISNLRRIQKYMVPLVLNEFSFLVMGPRGIGKTSGYLIPLLSKLVELKDIELRGRCGPIVIIVTHTEKMLKHVQALSNKYGRATGIAMVFTNSQHFEGDQTNIKYRNIDVLCCTAKLMVETIVKFQISLGYVKFLVIEEFEYCTNNSEYEKNLSELRDRLSSYAIFPTCIFLSVLLHKDWMFDVKFMEKMATTNVAKLIVPPLSDILVSVLPCSSIMDHCHWITRLLVGKDMEHKRTVVLVDAPRRAHYLALLLKYYCVSSKYITRDDNLIDVETAIRLWRTKECTVIVADYDSMRELDYGFVDTCVLFELPHDGCAIISKLIVDLSTILCYNRRVYIMINEDLDCTQAENVLKLLDSLDQQVPHFLVNMIDTIEESSTKCIATSNIS
ncbi:DEAD/DEAH box helicase [Dictyocaulus viviparus]|uniref:ATP-dependent RNA helicase n=1 Tax=Dictyocaulus viviparus TaxID=29172 RepID=A0A0D8XN80_DICVI|nr:DEAD/DEAH box helicase [Dictyocaulus viviparus]